MLAIAAPGVSAPSETFIRDHVRGLAPGRTVLLCQEGTGEGAGVEALDCPALVVRWPPPLAYRAGVELSDLLRRAVTGGHKALEVYMTPCQRQRATAFLRETGAQALLAEYGLVGMTFAPVARAAGIPLFVHVHGHDASAYLRTRGAIAGYRALFGQAAGIIAPSRFLADKLAAIGCPPQRLHVNPCGVDPGLFTPTQAGPLRALGVGRLVEKKAPHLTVEAFARVAERIPDARLQIIGSGPLEARCRSTVARHGLGDRVALLGARSHAEVAGAMRESGLFVQHSVTGPDGDVEGLPVAILEAMAAGLPVVATRHSGIPEAVLDGVTGLLVDEHDVAGMAGAIATLLSEPDRAAAMGRAGRARLCEHFSRDRSLARLRTILGL